MGQSSAFDGIFPRQAFCLSNDTKSGLMRILAFSLIFDLAIRDIDKCSGIGFSAIGVYFALEYIDVIRFIAIFMDRMRMFRTAVPMMLRRRAVTPSMGRMARRS